MLYESEAPDTWKEPRLKALGRQLGQWTEKTATRRNTTDWEWRRF